MSEVREEVEKCKQIARTALAAGDAEKAVRFLQKAKRMCPEDTSLDALLSQASSGGPRDATPTSGNRTASPPRFRSNATGTTGATSVPSRSGTTTNKAGQSYTSEQFQIVQRILRTKDYYEILEVPKGTDEDGVKKAYKKIALRLHPDKNKAPGAEEAFKKLSTAVQCLTDRDKRQVYDRYGDEERIPQQHRHSHQQDFMTPEDLFAAFFGGGVSQHHGQQRQQQNRGDPDAQHQAQRGQMMQALPVILLVILTLASNFSGRDTGSRFSFNPTNQYRSERSTAALRVPYYVADDFSEHYVDGSRSLAEFDRQVEIYHVRQLHSDCDYQEKLMYKKVMIAKRVGDKEELEKARNHPRPACKEIERIKNKHSNIYRSALHMVAY